jgi:hypothetical protein
MAEAKTPSAQYLSGEDPEIVEANKRYQDAVARLSDSLANRKMMFDPTLLAMAEGFLSPTQTGGFGESLGKAAGKVGAAQEIEDKRQMGLREREVAVAGQGIELQRMKQRDAELLKYLGESQPPSGPLTGPQAGATAAPRAVTLPKIGDKYPYTYVDPIDRKYGTTETRTVTQDDLDQAKNYKGPTVQLYPDLTEPRGAGALSQAAGPKVVGSPQGALSAMQANKPPGFENVEGIQTMPANPNFMTGRDYVRLNRMDKSKSAADLIKEGQEIEQKRYRDKENGVQDLATGKFYSFPTGKTEEIQLYGYPGTHKVDARTAAKLSLLAANDDPAYHDLAKRVVEGPRKKGPENEGEKPNRLKSVQELDLEAKKAEKLQSAAVESEIESRKDFNQRKKDADETITTANVFRKFATDPNAKSMFGILNDDKISSGIATLVRDGIGLPGFTVGTKAIEDVMRNANLKPADQAKYRTFLMYATQMQLQQSKYMKGAVSDFEQRLMANAGITGQDTPESIRMKADLMTRRAQFDRRVAKAFKDSKMTADEFIDSDRYMEMRDKYNEDLAELSSGSKVLAPTPAKPAAPAAGGAEPSKDFIRDPVTGVIRRKKAGE